MHVLNAAPVITSLVTEESIAFRNPFNFMATATDPGINDILTYEWDFDGDGSYEEFRGDSGQWKFAKPGIYTASLRVSDEDGG